MRTRRPAGRPARSEPRSPAGTREDGASTPPDRRTVPTRTTGRPRPPPEDRSSPAWSRRDRNNRREHGEQLLAPRKYRPHDLARASRQPPAASPMVPAADRTALTNSVDVESAGGCTAAPLRHPASDGDTMHARSARLTPRMRPDRAGDCAGLKRPDRRVVVPGFERLAVECLDRVRGCCGRPDEERPLPIWRAGPWRRWSGGDGPVIGSVRPRRGSQRSA